MAILKPFECTVEVDGVALAEYDDEDTEQAMTTTSLAKYIEAVSGANFRVKLTIQPGWTMKADYVAWYLTLDSKTYGGGVFRSERYDGSHSCTTVRSGVVSGAGDDWTQRKFKFADIVIGETSADEEPEEMKKRYERLGNISIEIWRMRLVERMDHLGQVRHDPLYVVPEKALKGQALSLSTDLGPSEPMTDSQTIFRGEKVEPFPVATFHFKYRSRESLKQLLVVPRSPSPMPLEERDPEDLTPAEAQELIRRQRARLAEIQAIKKEDKSSNKRDRSSIEPPIRPVKVTRTASGHSYLELDDSSDDAQIVKVEACSTRKSNASGEVEVINLID